jgi:hypothetical protein
MFSNLLEYKSARRQWLIPVILATQEAEIVVRSQPGQIVGPSTEKIIKKTPEY